MAAKAEGKSKRRRSDETVGGICTQHITAVAVAGREQVAMKVHRALGFAGRAGGECDQADIFCRGGTGGEGLIARLAHQAFEFAVFFAGPVNDALEIGRQRLCLFHVFGEAAVAQRERDLRLAERIGNFLGAQEGHGRHCNPAGLDDREQRGSGHRRIRRTQ